MRRRSLKEMNKAIEANPRFEKARVNADFLEEIYKKILMVMRNAYSSANGEKQTSAGFARRAEMSSKTSN